MAAVVVMGAGGVTGRRLAESLQAAGHVVTRVPADADVAAVRAAGADLAVLAVRDVADRAALMHRLVAAGTSVLDAGADALPSGGPADDAYERLDAAARAGGVVAVPAAGAGLGDLLAAAAAEAVRGPREVHVCWAFPDRGGWRRALAPGYRATAAGRVTGPLSGPVEGRGVQEERTGEIRRLAWFPRPIGPAHAAVVPGPEAQAVPRHAPAVRVARTYLAMPAWRAELLQATATLARHPRVHRLIDRRWSPGGDPVVGPDAVRWACVAEAAGSDGVARAWANGRDPVGLGVGTVVALAAAVLAGHCDAGALPPARVDVPTALLDRLAAATRLRWSLIRPRPADGPSWQGGPRAG
ncbi:hypothetical protein [Egicoccus halophilus]|uniref:Uncharacterized protein n=1 Tax=Egicoccus halophilus TaxID=1670830 RepID=A0A8J3ACI7_9ACTN|nr:hypothetical protein [Egicoccus halophilus]GGI05104.1 hypothetical protein GCM10011354_12430 [Egicoccus halophilus]